MTTHADRLASLLAEINGGRAAEALPELDQLLQLEPENPATLALRAEALRLSGRVREATDAYRHAGRIGAGPRNWLIAGILLAGERKTDEAVSCLQSALAESPDDEQVLDTLVTTLFNSNRQREALGFARRLLAVGANTRYLSNAALLLNSCDCYEEATDAFKKIVALAPDDPALIGAALAPARFTCEWDWIEFLQRRINAWYEGGDFAPPREYPLTHLTWCANEARNLGVTRAYVERMVPRVETLRHETRTRTGRIRVGYLSCDFRNHATMHLMAGLFEHHDRERFEVFAYDYSSHDISEYRQRFTDAVEHHIEIHSLSDQEAAERIAQDRLDILFDLKGYTGGGRATILAYRPAALQAAYLGFPGSAASADIDFIVSDRFVTPDSSAAYYTEKFCRLPQSYQCNDCKRPVAAQPGTRAMHGLPEDKIVFGAFNQSYKVDRGSFDVWLRILRELPQSVLWLLGQSQTAIANLKHHAELAGIEPTRLVFAPFAWPHDHLARLQLADAVLDTLVCNGHTTTSDALWAAVPVITARGQHFASRVSESLLNAMELPELVGDDHEDMVRIATRIGTDAEYRAALRRKVANNRLTAPLFDTARFTRDFELGIELMVEQRRGGAPLEHIDVPDRGPVTPRATEPGSTAMTPALLTAFRACPLCEGSSVTLGFADCSSHALWHLPLPRTLEWVRCPACGHVHTRNFWTDAGLAEIVRSPNAGPSAVSASSLDADRAMWSPVVERAVGLLGGYQAVANRAERPIWVDVGCGDGALVMTAADHGFAAVGLDIRDGILKRMRELGFNALQHDFMTLKFEVVPSVLSMMEVLEQIPRPGEALAKAAQVLEPGGVLVLSTSDLNSSSWRAMEAEKANPCWSEIERYHVFSRDRLVALLTKSGFELVDFTTPNRRRAQMELYALRK
jgi:predicted O-linked N-acetylglucosamine transferase (SPINDLY family)/SAM-dependent methyltransferase